MSYLIKDTTEEERKLIINKALAISLSGSDEPTKETLELAKKYIEGKIELDELQKLILKKYKIKGENQNE